jgi:hypothetical protein
VRVAAEADWPQQARLLQLFDNRDGTLSLFGTIVDHAGEPTAPAPGTAVSALGPADLASIGRTLSYNDHQTGGAACSPDPCGEGAADDRNVELLIADPRRGPAAEQPPGNEAKGNDKGKGKKKKKKKSKQPKGGGRCDNVIAGTPRRDTLLGTSRSDLLLGKGGADRIRPRRGEDCVYGGRGRDRVYARGGGEDRIRCGRGRDVAFVDRKDSVKGCERVRRGKVHPRR